jgi:L-lysine exporter family protein LysE/ArgO
MLFSVLEGFSIGASLIIAIGAQNAFVIRQGLRRQHLLLTASVCSLIDALFILVGVLGFGHLIASYPLFMALMRYLAIAFLFVYGALSFKAALHPKPLKAALGVPPSATKTLLILLALGFFNPHVYLDTILLLGSIASQRPEEEQIPFALGAIAASFTWFFAITYGAQLIAPFLRKESSWRKIDLLIAFIMWGIALTLV